jgi:hypothetical protein
MTFPNENMRLRCILTQLPVSHRIAFQKKLRADTGSL